MLTSTLSETLFQYADTAPDAACCVLLHPNGKEYLTFNDLLQGSLEYAGRYQQAGVRPGSVVLIALQNGLPLVYAFWGAILAGVVPSIIAPLANRQRLEAYAESLQHLTTLCGDAHIVLEEQNHQQFLAVAGVASSRLLNLSVTNSAAINVTAHRAQPGDTAFLQFSSGTTGQRKGIVFTHEKVLAQMQALQEVLKFESGDRIASWLPLYHDMGLIACFIAPVMLRVPFIMMDALSWVNSPVMLLEAIETYRATHVWLPNFAFNHLAQTVREDVVHDLSSVRAWINCSEPCKSATFDSFMQRFSSMGVKRTQLQTCYAMAETVFAVTHTSLGGVAAVANNTLLSVGKPVPGMQVRIADAQGNDVPSGEMGEIQVRGVCLMDGYFGNEALDSDAYVDGWFRTGDLGYFRDDELYVCGRSKDVIIVNGRNVFAHEIEAIIATLDGVKPGRALALGMDNPVSGSEDLVVLVEATSVAPDDQAVRRNIKNAVMGASGLNVTRVVQVPPGWLVKTTSGKLDRVRNKQRYQEERHG